MFARLVAYFAACALLNIEQDGTYFWFCLSKEEYLWLLWFFGFGCRCFWTFLVGCNQWHVFYVSPVVISGLTVVMSNFLFLIPSLWLIAKLNNLAPGLLLIFSFSVVIPLHLLSSLNLLINSKTLLPFSKSEEAWWAAWMVEGWKTSRLSAWRLELSR